jgi:hypothetical protein
MVDDSKRVNDDTARARQQAAAQLASIEDMVTCLAHAQACDNTECGADCPHDEDEAREAIRDDALSVDVRTDWHSVGAVESAKPTHYRILLCTGGPAVQLVGTLDDDNQPDSAALQYQDWFTPWIDSPLTDEEEQTLLMYAQQFYFDA